MDNSLDRQAEKQLIKSRVRLDEVARDLGGCELHSRGADDLWACCPFHTEDTPSFHVRPALGMYKCFGCGESGDVFSFVQRVQGVGFREALELLAERAGVTLGSLSPAERREQTEARRLRAALDRARDVFTAALREGGDNPAWIYLARRGFEPRTLERFDVGFVPTDFERRLRTAELGTTDIDRSGFTRQFGGRISFGIRDAHGSLVGFGARMLGDGEGPKYVNTRETAAFNKRRLLYGLDKAARAIARTRRMVVMEGYTDVMMAHQRGLDEAVATMGTSLTADHVRLLKERAGNLVFVFDGDDAGRSAADRAVRLALSEGVECRVLTLPEGQDPCDWFGSHDLEAFERLLRDGAMSTVTFLCRRVLAELDPDQPGGRARAAGELLELTRSLRDPVRRDGIVAEIARECGVDRNVLLREGGAGARRDGADARRSAPGRVRADIRSQFVAVAGLATRATSQEDLDELERLGALSHPAALRLRELGLAAGRPPLDPSAWLERVAEHEPALHASLERLLMPSPDAVLPGYEEAVTFLRSSRAAQLDREARRSALSRPDLASDDAALRALDASLRAARGATVDATHDTTAQPEGGATSVTIHDMNR